MQAPNYLWICVIASALWFTVFLDTSNALTVRNQRVGNFPKYIRRKIESAEPKSGEVQTLEPETRPSTKPKNDDKVLSKLRVGAPEIIRREDHGTLDEESSDDDDYQQPPLQDSEELLQGGESLFYSSLLPALKPSAGPIYPIPIYGRPTTISPRPPPTFGTFRPTTLSPFPQPTFATFRPTTIVGPPAPPLTFRPTTQPTDMFPPVVSIVTTTSDPIDLGTFPPFIVPPGELPFGPSPSGTTVPILVGPPAPLRERARNLFGSKRPVVGSTVPRKRVLGGPSSVRPNSKETLRELKETIHDDPNIIKDFMFSDIKCYRTKQKEYFGTMVHMRSGFHLPYIRDRPDDPLSSNDCRMEATDAPNSYHMKISDLRGCGVEQCGDSMCLTMVFPRVPMLALADDEVTTIKCVPQKSTMSETKTISFAGDSLENRRSSSTVEGGTQEFAAEVGVFRQNPGARNGLFVKRVNSGGVVQLGEPLQLRSVVRGGDGWTFSKLTDVKVMRMRDSFSHNMESLNPNDATEVITLVDPNGCRNGDFKVISDFHPLRDPRNDLVHHFNFKAFLFRGQRANEPLIITAKVVACQDPEDCGTMNCSNELEPNSEVSRFKRSPHELKNSSAITRDWSSQLALRVTDHPSSLSEQEIQGVDDDDESRSFSSFSCNDKIAGSAIFSGVLTLVICILVVTLVTFCQRSRLNKHTNAQLTRSRSLPSSLSSVENPIPILKRSQSFHPDIFRTKNLRPDKSSNRDKTTRREFKPLPAPPMEQQQTRERNSTKLSKSDVSKLLNKLSSQNTPEEPAEYECIPEDQNNNFEPEDFGRDSDAVYVLYYCNRKGSQHRSKSAPASLRGKKKLPKNIVDDETDVSVEVTATESDDSLSENTNEGIHRSRERRTVRSVKRSQKEVRHKNIRQKLSAIYGPNTKQIHGSFPVRINSKKSSIAGPGDGTRSCRERKRVNFAERLGYNQGDEISTQLSSEDSAYSGSLSSTIAAGLGSSDKILRSRSRPEGKSCIPLVYADPFSISNSEPNSSNLAGTSEIRHPATTHFVTRTDLTTQIIIIPETKV